MERQEKIEIIDKNSDLFIAMLDDFIKSMEYLTDTLLVKDENNKYNPNPLIENASKNDKAMKVLISMTREISAYKEIREKLIKGDLNFDLKEINLIAYACKHTFTIVNNQIDTLTKARELCVDFYDNLTSPELR